MDILTIILLLVGFVILIKGADFFVAGASDLASKLKIPVMIIGLTIVAFGTSLPEAAVSVTSAMSNFSAIAFSNVIGSNIFNILFVLGVTAILGDIVVKQEVIKKEFPVLILSSLLLLIFLITGNQISQIEGLILLIGIITYVLTLVRRTIKQPSNLAVSESKLSTLKIILYISGGLIGIIVGGNLVVSSAKAIALDIGMSETLVGLTIVAIGTSLPELTVSITALKNNETDIALGNAVGSNIFNILFIIGLTTVISPIKTTGVMITDAMLMIVVTIIGFILSKDKFDLNKKDGIILVTIFIIYMIVIILRN